MSLEEARPGAPSRPRLPRARRTPTRGSRSPRAAACACTRARWRASATPGRTGSGSAPSRATAPATPTAPTCRTKAWRRWRGPRVRPRSWPTRTSTRACPTRRAARDVDGLASPDFGGWTTERVVELALAVDRAARSREGVTQVENSVYSDAQGSVALANSRGFAASYSATQAWAYSSAFAGEGADLMTGLGVGMGRDPGELDPEAIGAEAAERALALVGARQPREPPLPGGAGRVRRGVVHRLHRRDDLRRRGAARPLAVRRSRGGRGRGPGAPARRRRHRAGGAVERPLRRRGHAHALHAADRGRPPARLSVRLAHRRARRAARPPATRAAARTGRPRRWGPRT